jgi:hypothetical protein
LHLITEEAYTFELQRKGGEPRKSLFGTVYSGVAAMIDGSKFFGRVRPVRAHKDRVSKYTFRLGTAAVNVGLGGLDYPLVERSLGFVSQPEFKDPFALSVANERTLAPLNGPRQSIIGGIAPNQPAPSGDITQISQRLITLTTSVGQLLVLQTQQHVQNTNAGVSNNHMLSLGHQLADLAPN